MGEISEGKWWLPSHLTLVGMLWLKYLLDVGFSWAVCCPSGAVRVYSNPPQPLAGDNFRAGRVVTIRDALRTPVDSGLLDIPLPLPLLLAKE